MQEKKPNNSPDFLPYFRIPCSTLLEVLSSFTDHFVYPPLATFAPVPGSPTPRELAMAEGSVRKHRIGPWSSWGFGERCRPERPSSGRAARGVCDENR